MQLEILNPNPSIYQAARLEFLMTREKRLRALKLVFLVSFTAIVLFAILLFLSKTPAALLAQQAMGWEIPLLGIFLLSFSIFWPLWMLDFYFLAASRSSPFLVKKENGLAKTYFLEFGGARRALYLRLLDGGPEKLIDLGLLYDFFYQSKFMRLLPLRLGVEPQELSDFLNSASHNIKITQKEILSNLISQADSANSDTIGAREFMLTLFDFDQALKSFLFAREIRKEELDGAAKWIAVFLENQRQYSRWWEKAALGRIPGIGKDLSFGFTYTLDKFSHSPYPAIKSRGSAFRASAHQKGILAIEEILSKNAEANVLMVGEEGSGKHTILGSLHKMIREGSVMPALEHKRMIILDTGSISALAKTKGALEELLIKLVREAVSAGNIILVMENFPDFFESASKVGVDVISLWEPYLSSSAIQAIAVSDPAAFHQTLERNSKFMKLFSKVDIAEPKEEELVAVLENEAETLEKKSGIVITYQAVRAAADLAERFITNGAMPEKAVDLLDQAASSKKDGIFLVPRDIEKVIESSTKVPIGTASREESEKLLNLETFLHKRVIGQDEAIKAVSGALRRVRAGLHKGRRPVGSFLFLGPTGVGKTETAKALAEAYFGSEQAMSRFDMSEFYGPEGLEKLIGSFSAKQPGLLATALREKPFGILLFDEFEKSSKEVINLFLQILDEGIFKDALGKSVSARDSIIIATSNAGSNMIWELVKEGKDPASLQKEVIESVRREGIFSPEIINRFDAIVVYHPLRKNQLEQVAKIILQELAQTLKTKDIEFVVTPKLVEKVVEIGYDPVMGARPMRRAVKEAVEELVAKKILEGRLPRGSVLELSDEEIKAL